MNENDPLSATARGALLKNGITISSPAASLPFVWLLAIPNLQEGARFQHALSAPQRNSLLAATENAQRRSLSTALQSDARQMTAAEWPGRQHRATVTRLYVILADVEPELPYPAGPVRLYRSEATLSLPQAEDCHRDLPYFLEIRGLMGGEAMVNLAAALHAIEIWSDTCIEPRVRVSYDGTSTARWVEVDFGAPWGHYADLLPAAGLDAIAIYGARIATLVQANAFNPLSNALRFYFAGLRMLPSDVALVTLVSALEALFTTSDHGVSASFRRGVAAFLESDPAARQKLHDYARDVYSWRSTVVHGNQLDPDGERTAIMLSEELTPAAETLCRRTFRKFFEERLDAFLETDTASIRRQLYDRLWQGEALGDVLAALHIARRGA